MINNNWLWVLCGLPLKELRRRQSIVRMQQNRIWKCRQARHNQNLHDQDEIMDEAFGRLQDLGDTLLAAVFKKAGFDH